MVGAFFFA